MLTLKSFENKVLVSYLYEEDKLVPYIDYTILGPVGRIKVIKGKKRGVVVAIGNGMIGWSLCKTSSSWYHESDVFDKAKGLDLALKRADIASTLTFRDRESFYSKVPFSLKEIFDDMNTRSQKYFQGEDDDLPF